jgi:hypothetical protein
MLVLSLHAQFSPEKYSSALLLHVDLVQPVEEVPPFEDQYWYGSSCPAQFAHALFLAGEYLPMAHVKHRVVSVPVL